MADNDTPNDTAAPTEAAAAAAASPNPAARRPDKLDDGLVRKKQKKYTPLLPTTNAAVSKFASVDGKAKTGDDIKLNFAQRLMELLEKDDVKPILHWSEDGTSICFEDLTKFSDEVMPKYFSDTKYKSFMVRMKRELSAFLYIHKLAHLCSLLLLTYISYSKGWGFKNVPDNPTEKHSTSKIMACELFRRNKPELCLLMGDERRIERINVAKAIIKKDSKKKVMSKTNAATETPAEVAPPPITSAAAVSSSSIDLEWARLNYQRSLQNLQTYNLLNAGLSSSRSPFSLPSTVLSSSYGRLGSSSYLGGLSGLDAADLRGEYHGGAIADVSLVAIERDIQYCLEVIATHRERLSLLQNIKDIKLGLRSGNRSMDMNSFRTDS
jgi:hypothetical protein